MKRSSIRGTRGGVRASRGVGASLLLAPDLPAEPCELANSSCFLVGLAGGLLQGLHQAQDSGVITMEL